MDSKEGLKTKIKKCIIFEKKMIFLHQIAIN